MDLTQTYDRPKDGPGSGPVTVGCFIADEPVYLSQLSAFAHCRPDPLPGTIFGGRFPISLWAFQSCRGGAA